MLKILTCSEKQKVRPARIQSQPRIRQIQEPAFIANFREKGWLFMNSSNTVALECNKKTKINFYGGDLSPGSGLLPLYDSAAKVGLIRLYIFFHPIRSGYHITIMANNEFLIFC